MSDLKDNKIKLANLISIIDNFFNKKGYQTNSYLSDLKNEISDKCGINFKNIQLANILIVYKSNSLNIDKLKKIHRIINIEANKLNPQCGGFLYLESDNVYTQALNLIDFIIDIINIIPNNIITSNYHHIAAPYGISSLILNLMKGNYDFAFYSLIGLIPGIGGAISGSAKIIHKIISYISNKKKIDKSEEYYKQLQSSLRVHDYLKDETFERKNNPFLGNFEENYNYDNYYNDELDII